MSKKIIKTPSEKYEENMSNYMQGLENTIIGIIEKQEYLYEMQSFSMNIITALKTLLEKNGVISIQEFNDTVTDLAVKNKEFLDEEIKNNILLHTDIDNMANA